MAGSRVWGVAVYMPHWFGAPWEVCGDDDLEEWVTCSRGGCGGIAIFWGLRAKPQSRAYMH
jgi:hypothetical protein